MADQLRIVDLESGSIAVWIRSDGPLYRGWYYREYPKRADVCVTVFRWLNGVVSIKGWEQRDPPDVEEIKRADDE